jgi:hypothetical protein
MESRLLFFVSGAGAWTQGVTPAEYILLLSHAPGHEFNRAGVKAPK